MKHLKLFENFGEDLDPDYNFIIYLNGEVKSGWEYLSDAIENGIGEDILDIYSEDVGGFMDQAEYLLSESDIDINDDAEDIDEGMLNDAISELVSTFGDYDITISVNN